MSTAFKTISAQIPVKYPKYGFPKYDEMVKLVDVVNMAIAVVDLKYKYEGDEFGQRQVAEFSRNIRKVFADLYDTSADNIILYPPNEEEGSSGWYCQAKNNAVSMASYSPVSKVITIARSTDDKLFDPDFYYIFMFHGFPEVLLIQYDSIDAEPSDISCFGAFKAPDPSSVQLVKKRPKENSFVVMRKRTGPGRQIALLSEKGKGLNTEMMEMIKKHWDKYYITTASYTPGGWLFIMQIREKNISQSFSWGESGCPLDWMKEKREKEGKMLTAIASKGSQWFGVVTTDSPYKDQVYCFDVWDVVEEFIGKWWKEDYYITHAAWSDGKWLIVMSKTDMYTEQQYFFASNHEELSEKIKERWEQKQTITLIKTGDSFIFCVMSREASNGGDIWENYVTGREDMKSVLNSLYKLKYVVSYLGD